MSETNTARRGAIVSIHYTLYLQDGTIVESSQEAFDYLHGANNIVPGLEEALEGHATGHKFNVEVPAAKGYGERVDEAVQTAKLSAFPPEVQLEPGLQFLTEMEDGTQVPGTITAITGDDVTVDFNHPLAGKELRFEGEVLGVREATPEETQHGHPAGWGHEGGCDHEH